MAQTLGHLHDRTLTQERSRDYRRDREDQLGRLATITRLNLPLLDQMVQEGAIRKRGDGRYELTDKGKDEGTFPFGFPFSQRPNSVDSMVSEMKDFVSYFEYLAKSNASKIAEYKGKLKDRAASLTRLFEQS